MNSPEKFFMKYAFPCAHVLLQAGSITQEEYDELKKRTEEEDFPSREIIESHFPDAFRRIKNLAKEMQIKDHWDMKVLEEYWYHYHNKMIDQREGNYSNFPESFCEFCKTHVAEVIEILPEKFLLIEYEGKKRPVSKDYVPEAKVGDKVWVHHAYATEIIN